MRQYAGTLGSALAALCVGVSLNAAAEPPPGEHHVYVHLLAPGPAGAVQVTVSDETAPPAPAATDTQAPAPLPAAAGADDSAETGVGADLGLLVFVFVLAIFLGFELIAKVPSQLHTPLMSGSNAISGITVVGALIASGMGHVHGRVPQLLGTLAVAMAMINVVGGYMVTDRMLGMFKRKGGQP